MLTETFSIHGTSVWLATATEEENALSLQQQQHTALQLLAAAGYNPHDLCHTPEGCPYLNRSAAPFISIAHTQRMVAFALSDKPLGIDVEAIAPRTLRVMPRIISKREKETLHLNEDIATATRIWCTKEAVFKAYSTKATAITDVNIVQLNDIKATTSTPYSSEVFFKEYHAHIVALALTATP